MEFVNIYQFRFHPMLKYACVYYVPFVCAGLYSCLPPLLIRVVMFGCIIAGSLCSIVSVLSCVACSLLYISCGLSAVEINEELLLGHVALVAQRPIVIKLSRERSVGRSVGLSVQCIVEKRQIAPGGRLVP